MSGELNFTWKCIFVHIFKQSQTKCIKRLAAVTVIEEPRKV